MSSYLQMEGGPTLILVTRYHYETVSFWEIIYQPWCLVAAWEGKNYVVPWGSPRDWETINEGIIPMDDLVAHIPMSALQEGAKRENLDWEKECVPRMPELIEKLILQIEPIHFSMIACRKFKREIEEGII